MGLIQEPPIFFIIALLRAAVGLLGSLILPKENMGFGVTDHQATNQRVSLASVTLARRILVREKTFTCTGGRKRFAAENAGTKR